MYSAITRTRCRSLWIRSQSRHSEWALDTHRSAYAFAFGAAIGVRMMSSATGGEHSVEAGDELGIPSRIRNRGVLPSSASDIEAPGPAESSTARWDGQ